MGSVYTFNFIVGAQICERRNYLPLAKGMEERGCYQLVFGGIQVPRSSLRSRAMASGVACRMYPGRFLISSIAAM